MTPESINQLCDSVRKIGFQIHHYYCRGHLEKRTMNPAKSFCIAQASKYLHVKTNRPLPSRLAALSDAPVRKAFVILIFVMGSIHAAFPQNTASPAKAHSSSKSPISPDSANTGNIIPSVSSLNFFKIDTVKLLQKEPDDRIGVWQNPSRVNARDGKARFLPCLEVKVSVKENTRSDTTFAKAYFYGEDNKIITTLQSPSPVGTPDIVRKYQVSRPVLYYKDRSNRFFFEIPDVIIKPGWKAVVVFGDSNEVQVATYPQTCSSFQLDYPEKKLAEARSAKRVDRKPAMDPLIKHVVLTKNPTMPQITLYLRPPNGVTDANDIQGILAICILANDVEEIKRDLQKEEMGGDYCGICGFANKHKLAILAWGSNSKLWTKANYDDLDPSKEKERKTSFDLVANAWEEGVLELGKKYGIPTKNFLLWGQCASAHLAHALCLAKPDYFLAISINLPGFFEKPTPEASKVLWCVTTGERYYSYDYSLRFVADCKKLGYPIVYKAIVDLGHESSPDAAAMWRAFFEFALTQKALREDYDRKSSNAIDKLRLKKSPQSVPWPESFQHPPYFGNIIYQEVYPASQADMIPEGFRTPLPTEEIKKIWELSK